MSDSPSNRAKNALSGDILVLALIVCAVWVTDALHDTLAMGEPVSFIDSVLSFEPPNLIFRGLVALALFIVVRYVRRVSDQRIQELEARNQAEERFRRAFEDSAVGMATASLEGRLLHANQAFCAMLGYRWEELVGMTLRDISVTEDLEVNIRLQKRLLAGELNSFQMEKEYITKGGGVVSGLLGVSLVRDSQGRPMHFLAQIQDVTERKRAAVLLAESDEKLRTISESAHDGIIMLDPKGVVTFWNPAAESIFGYAADEAIGRDAHVLLLGAEDLESYSQGFDRFALSGQGSVVGRTVELQARRKDGSTVPVELSISGVQIEGAWHAVAVVRDVSERIKEQRALKESESRFRSLFEHSPLGMALVTEDMRYIDVNEAFTQMFGYSRDETLKLSVADLSAEEDMDRNLILQSQAIDTGTDRYQLEKSYRRKDGSSFWGRVFGSVVRDESGEPAYFIGMTEDVTATRRNRELGDTLDGLNLIISSTLDVHSILPQVLAGSVVALDADEGMVLECNSGIWSVAAQSGASARDTLVTDPKLEDQAFQFLNSIVHSPEPLFIRPVDGSDSDAFFQVASHPVSRCLFAPLRVREETLGAVCFFRSDDRMACGESERDFITRLAVSLSLAQENARMFEAERRIADILQEAVLAVPGDIADIDFGHLYRSATESAKIGGDFYDLFELEEGKVGVLIGDVSGKGLDAAALTSLVKNTVRAYAQQERSPAVVVSKTNDLMFKTSMSAAFVTLIFGILDKRTRTYAYCNAGHPSAMVKGKGGIRHLEEGISSAIGIAPDVDYEVRREQIAPDETLVLYTDGVTEARNEDGFFGYKGLEDALAGSEATEAQGTVDAVYDAIVEYTGAKLRDDVAIAAIKLA